MIEYVNRLGSDCYKWDSEHVRDYCNNSPLSPLPLWVADMDFKAAPAIIDALQRRLDHGVFGYQCVPQDYYDAIASWFSRRHGWKGITRQQIIYTTGVVPAISAILRALSDRKTNTSSQHLSENHTGASLKVLTFTPAYNCFFSSIANTGCQLVSCPLTGHSTQPLPYFTIDWELFEKQAAEADVLLLCNPHNPTGRVWTHHELTRIALICKRYNIFVLSDEIHCELTFPGYPYTPFAVVAQEQHNNSLEYCVCTAASKAFNIAGLQCANIFVPDQDIRARIDKAINIHEVCDISPFGMTALIAAYNDSEEWICELQQLLFDNYHLLCRFFNEQLPQLRVTQMEGTYLAWVDIRPVLEQSSLHSAQELCNALANEQHVLFNPSEMYGAEGFIRINFATSPQNITKALQRFKHFLLHFSTKTCTIEKNVVPLQPLLE